MVSTRGMTVTSGLVIGGGGKRWETSVNASGPVFVLQGRIMARMESVGKRKESPLGKISIRKVKVVKRVNEV